MPWSDTFMELLHAFWDEYGVVSALLLFGLAFYQVYVHKLWTARLRDKDTEIKRLVEDRNRLQDVVLPKRLSSEEQGDA